LDKQQLLTIGEAARWLGVSVDTLRRWDKKGHLSSVRLSPAGHRYYRREDLESFLPKNSMAQALRWVGSQTAQAPDDAVFCPTRDIFQARLSRLEAELKKALIPESQLYLLVAIAGEIGNNSFDHNLGSWPDIQGIFFACDVRRRQIVLADRGQGILKTLSRVRPHLRTHSEALRVAFEEIVSGRAPEARGNGLKFVKNIIVSNPFQLRFETGDAGLDLKQGDATLKIQKTKTSVRGCFSIISF